MSRRSCAPPHPLSCAAAPRPAALRAGTSSPLPSVLSHSSSSHRGDLSGRRERSRGGSRKWANWRCRCGIRATSRANDSWQSRDWSGSGFIGGGIIFVRSDAVRGLTTAATVWLTCAVGMARGGGLPLPAMAVTVLHFLVVRGCPFLLRKVRTDPAPSAVSRRAEFLHRRPRRACTACRPARPTLPPSRPSPLTTTSPPERSSSAAGRCTPSSTTTVWPWCTRTTSPRPPRSTTGRAAGTDVPPTPWLTRPTRGSGRVARW
ncbi:MgtC/SapB family protein [Streptomyces sp. NPDC051014]|uniref:MgtC/SapB family protein n=1 Tax=Streptomyces sp. NPDC051014 TaxID=3155751 RepID=UPI00340E9D77